jgi:type III pantothenate kinase
MKLLLDLGNSRVKWCWSSAGFAGDPGACDHRGLSGAQIAAALPDPSGRLDEIRIASVASPGLTDDLSVALAARYGCRPAVAASAAAAGGLRNGYREPRQLGVDRWLALRGACARDPRSAACVIAAGTAFTLDLVMPGGEHLGGLIVPGLSLMQEALKGATGNLARLAAEDPPPAGGESAGNSLVGQATGEAMARGARWALAALAAHHFSVLRERSPDARLVVTGGDAPQLLPLLPGSAEHRPHLVLEGLALDPFTAGQLSDGAGSRRGSRA